MRISMIPVVPSPTVQSMPSPASLSNSQVSLRPLGCPPDDDTGDPIGGGRCNPDDPDSPDDGSSHGDDGSWTGPDGDGYCGH